MDREYKQWMANMKKKAAIEEGKTVIATVVDDSFWESVEELTSLCKPIISLLRLVDGTVPCVGKVYWKMYQIDNDIENAPTEEQKKLQLRKCINERWKMMHTQLHSAGFVLDPEFRLFLQHENEEVMSDFHAMVERTFKEDVQAQFKAIQQHATYRAGRLVLKTHGRSCSQRDDSIQMVACIWSSRA